ncbi:MAG: type II toxin-antitoxin system VapC family toxin, partial [Synechococcaceae bacterium WB7_1C_051]|nr:type II toxin-antitoxin system VapC family toxin [Synechococcaceae bacterium WB7_1C_051]
LPPLASPSSAAVKNGEEVLIYSINSSRMKILRNKLSVAELFVGVREGEERERLDAFVAAFDSLPLGREEAVQAGLWRRQYGPSHGTGLADALIASTVAAVGATLATLNRRHFPMLNDVLVPYVKPQQ